MDVYAGVEQVEVLSKRLIIQVLKVSLQREEKRTEGKQIQLKKRLNYYKKHKNRNSKKKI